MCRAEFARMTLEGGEGDREDSARIAVPRGKACPRVENDSVRSARLLVDRACAGDLRATSAWKSAHAQDAEDDGGEPCSHACEPRRRTRRISVCCRCGVGFVLSRECFLCVSALRESPCVRPRGRRRFHGYFRCRFTCARNLVSSVSLDLRPRCGPCFCCCWWWLFRLL